MLMKSISPFQVAFIAFLSISSSWAIEVKNAEEPKDKRETSVGYGSSGLSPHSFGSQIGHEGASAISVGAGYSVGGAKPYSFAGHASSAPLQLSAEGLQSSGHATIKLPPLTLQSNHGLAAGDLSQLMSQISHSINSGAINLQPSGGQELYAAQGEHGGQELSLPQYTFGVPQLQQYSVAEQPSVPAYAAGSKGLGSYGSSGPVLFTPSEAQGNSAALNYAPSTAHSLGDASSAGISLGSAPSSGHSFSGANFGHPSGQSLGALSLGGHSLGGHSLGGQAAGGHSLGGLSLGGHSFGGHSLGGSSLGGHSLGGHSLGAPSLGGHSSGGLYGGAFKSLGGSYTVPSKSSFKPSTFIGASVQGDSSHGLSSLSGSHGAPSFSGLSSGSHGLSLGSGGHGFGGSSTKYIGASYAPSKTEGFGSLESVANFASNGHLPSSHGSYSGPSTYGHATAAHAASSASPQYYIPSSKYSSSFGKGSSAYRAPVSSHGSLSSYSSGPKHGFGSRSSSRYASPSEDVHGSYSENSYNTIKYSEELKPRVH